MKKHIIFIILALFTLGFSGCKYDFILPVPEDNGGNGGTTNPVSFTNQVFPVLKNCAGCHSAGKSIDFSSSTAAYSTVSKLVNTATPAQSKIYTVPSPDGSHGMKLKTAEAALLLKWITEGAKNN